jgi:hypothetical protein
MAHAPYTDSIAAGAGDKESTIVSYLALSIVVQLELYTVYSILHKSSKSIVILIKDQPIQTNSHPAGKT